MKTIVLMSFLLITLPAAFATGRNQDKDQAHHAGYQPLLAFKGDTARYLMDNFVTNQSQYKNKPLNKVLKRLEVPVITYGPSLGGNAEGGMPNKCIAVVLKFFDTEVIRKKVKNNQQPAVLVIYLKDPQPREKSDQLFMKYHRFDGEVKKYYGKQLVDSISYTHYKTH